MTSEKKVILYIAASLDGYIAKAGDDLSFLSMVEKAGEDYGYAGFIDTVDTIIMGRKTYDWIMSHVPEYVHPDKTSWIITRTPRPGNDKLHFYTGDLKDLVLRLKGKAGKNIFIDGGAELVTALLQQNLIDELIISIIPVLLGDGIRLFSDDRPEQRLQLIGSKQYDTGLVQLHYSLKR